MGEIPVTTKHNHGRIFYGWWVVAASMGIGAVNSIVFIYGFSAFFIPWQRAFGWSRALLGGVVGISRLEGGLVAPVAGWFIDKYGPRRIIFIGLGMMGLGFFALSQVNSILMLYVVFLTLLATGSSFGTMRPCQVALAHWFVRRRGLAMGLLLGGPGLGGSLVFLFARLMDTFGWQAGAVFAGILIWVVGFPLATVIRHKPEQMGLLPDGDQPIANTDITAEHNGEVSPDNQSQDVDHTVMPKHFWMRDPRPEIDLTLWQAVRTGAFWLTALTWAVFSAMPGITTVHIAPYLAEELELEYVVAVSALSFFVFASVFGRVSFGFVADYVNIRLLIAFLLVMQAIGIYLFSEVQTLAEVPFYVIVFALPYGGMLPMRSVVQGYFFGKKEFGTIGGLLQFVDLPATVAAPIWVGYLADIMPGGYRIGFKITAGLLMLASGLMLFARRPRYPLPPDRPPLFPAMFKHQ